MVVAPRSLIFNWMEEAKRFSPQLRVLDHTGTGRGKSAEAFANFDVVLTTYGTMRNDIAFLKDIRFDYVVLDEAQAIKNANSEAAKASRLLSADHRLALSGTPVQNHLGELWSLFEFLNPGMLGSAKVLQMTSSASKQIDEPTRLLLSLRCGHSSCGEPRGRSPRNCRSASSRRFIASWILCSASNTTTCASIIANRS